MGNNEFTAQRYLRLISQFGGHDIKAVNMLNKAIYTSMCRFVHEPERSVLSTVYNIHEIFYAMDLPTLTIEYLSGTLSTVKQTADLLEVAEQRLQSTGLCGIVTTMLGLFEKRYLPPPKFIITASEICEDPPKICEYLARKYNSQYYFIDIPFFSDEKSVDYVAKQIENMVKFLEEHTGTKMDYTKLAEAIRFSNQATEYGFNIREIRKKFYPLIRGIGGIQLMTIHTLFGSKTAVEILQYLYEEICRRKAAQETPLPNNKYRLYWSHHFPPYALKLMSFIENKLHAAVVGEEIFDFSDILLDENEPYRSFARRFLAHPAHGEVWNRVKRLVKAAVEYNVDGVINFSPIGCRLSRSGVAYLSKELNARGIPFLELVGDNVDFRNYTKAQYETRLEAFIEIIKERNS